MSLLPLSLIKAWIRSRAFSLSFYESGCLKNIWSVLYGCVRCLSRNAMKTEEAYKYIQAFSITPSAERLVKYRKKNAAITVFFQTVAQTWFKITSSFQLCLLCLAFPQAICYTTEVFFQGSSFKNSFTLLYVHHVVFAIAKNKIQIECFFSPPQCWECSSGAQQAFHFIELLSPGTSWRHYTALMAMIGNMP